VSRRPPHSVEAEAAVLGAVLVDPSTLAELNGLEPSDFYGTANLIVFEAVRDLAAASKPIEAPAVVEELKRRGELEKIGGTSYLAQLSDQGMPSTIGYYAGVVAETARRRRLIGATHEIAELAHQDDPGELLEAKVAELSALARTDSPGGIPDSWRPVDVAEVMGRIRDGSLDRPTPTIGSRSDGAGLFYPGRLNGLFGRYGSLKSFVALIVAIQEIEAGRRVWWVDFEDDPFGTAERLVDLGADPEDVSARFRYLNPHEALSPASVRRVVAAVETESPSLVVIDSGGEWMSLQAVKPNQDEEVAAFYKTYVGPFTRAGAGVVALDHVPHESADKLRAIASQRKMAAVRGVAYRIDTILELGRGETGKATLVSAKDAFGHYPRETVVAEVTIDAAASPYTVSVDPPTGPAEWKPTVLMERISNHLAAHPAGLSKRRLLEGVSGKREYKALAIDLLIEDGYIAVEKKGGAHLHTLAHPYREADETRTAEQAAEIVQSELEADQLPDPY
jgi:hypothetical protein